MTQNPRHAAAGGPSLDRATGGRRSGAAAAAPEGPDGALSHRQIVTILLALMAGMFLAALDQTIVATAIRTIADDLKGLDQQAWATTAYLITSTIVTPLYGKLGDIYGRKKLFITAISIFVVGSVLCTLSTSMTGLAFFRAFQGLGAGGLFSLALAIIGDIVPARERAKYQGYFLAVFGTSSVLGPVIGGFFAGADSILGITGWRWVFLVNVPIGIIALALVTKTLHLRHQRLDHRIDWLGAALLAVTLVPLLLVAEQGRDWGWGSGRSIAAYVVGAVAAALFVVQENRMGAEAILPLKIFRNRTVGVSSAASVIIGMGMFGGLAALPLYLQIVKGASPTEAGLLLLPLTLGIMAGSISSGQIISRTGQYRLFPVTGAVLLTGSLFALHYTAFDTPLWKTMAIMVFFGLGLGFNFQPLTLAVQNAVPPQQIGVATSTATFTRQIGGTIGTAVFLTVLFSLVPERITSAFSTVAPTPEFQAALRDPANAAFAQQLQESQAGGSAAAASGVLQDSSFLSGLDPRLAKPFLIGFSEAMDTVFLVGAIVMVLAVFVLVFLPQVELRRGSAYSARADGEKAAAQAEPGTRGAHGEDGAGPAGRTDSDRTDSDRTDSGRTGSEVTEPSPAG